MTEERAFFIATAILVADFIVPTLVFMYIRDAREDDALYSHWRRSKVLFRKRRLRRLLKEKMAIVDTAYKSLEKRQVSIGVSKLKARSLLVAKNRARAGAVFASAIPWTIGVAINIAVLIISKRMDEKTPKNLTLKNAFHVYNGPLAAVQIGAVISSYMLLVFCILRMRRLRKIDSELQIYATALRALRISASTINRASETAKIDRDVNALCETLRTFATHGRPNAPLVRRAQISVHVSEVAATLEDASQKVLELGDLARGDLLRLLVKLFERAAEGRWHGLLDESDLTERAKTFSSDTSLSYRDKREFRFALAGIALAVIFAVVGALLGLPPSITLPLSAITATIPTAFAGGRRGRLSPGDLLNQARASLTPPQEGTSPNNAA
ncbi:hypothetical protein ACFWA4_13785 [Streptomyces sp. NPDC060011]|uniref:hypothetical protein n=1 Tax=Streptomyces sp. NPDC060011 TaxID=3347037 RepID=UPI00369B3CD2